MHRVPRETGCTTSRAAHVGPRVLVELASDYLFVSRPLSPRVDCYGLDPRVLRARSRCTRSSRVRSVFLDDSVTMQKRFSSIEYTDMIITYGMAGENAHAAARMYAERFPGREQYPTRYVIVSCVQRARDTGYVVPPRAYRLRNRVKEEERVPRAPDENPGVKVSPTADLFGLPRYTLRCTSPENGLHPREHRDTHQQLLAADLGERVHFCEGMIRVGVAFGRSRYSRSVGETASGCRTFRIYRLNRRDVCDMLCTF